MNPLPTNGTKYLGAVITVLGLITGTYHDAIIQWATSLGLQRWLLPAMLILSGILTTLRGFQNSANASAQAAAPPTVPTANPKSYFLWLTLPLAAMLLSVHGCASAPSTTQTFDEIAKSVAVVIDGTDNTIASLAASKTISSAQAQAALDISNKVLAAVTLANTAYSAGDLPTANAKIAAASAAIVAAQACLAEPPAQLVTCLAGVPTP